MKFCTKCGNEITNEKLFCSYCGNDLREETTTDIKSIEDNNSPTITPVETSTSNTKISKNSKLRYSINCSFNNILNSYY